MQRLILNRLAVRRLAPFLGVLFVALLFLSLPLEAAPPAAQRPSPRAAVPKQDAQDAARKDVDEVYSDAVAKAKTAAQQSQVAQQMLRDGLESADKPAVQFVLLRSAADLLAQAGEPDKAFQAIDDLAERFQINRHALRADAILKVAKTAKSTARQPLVTQALQVAEGLDARQDFATSKRLYDFAVDEAKARKDLALVKQALKQREQSGRLAKTFQGLQDAKTTLEQHPDDPQANQTVGAYYCFVRGDWAAGLPLLARASDEVLKPLAARDLDGAKLGAEQQLKLGDDWWAVADKRAGDATALHARAGYWYRRALPAVKGLARLKAEKRLATLPATDPAMDDDETPGGEAVRSYRFADPSSLADFVIKGAAKIEDAPADLPRGSKLWQIKDEELQIRSLGESKSTQVVLAQPFDSISEVVVKGRLVPPNQNNFRFEIGRYRFIFNWEMGDKNLILIDGNITHEFSPLRPSRRAKSTRLP